MRWWPRSLLGQVLLAVTLALLVGQAISGILLWRAAEARRETAMLNIAALQILRQPTPAASQELRDRRRERRQRFRRNHPDRSDTVRQNRQRRPGPRPLPVQWVAQSPVLPGEQGDPARESELATMLANQGVAVESIFVVEREMARDPHIRSRPRMMARIAQNGTGGNKLLIAAVQRPGDDLWSVARIREPRPREEARRTILLQTGVILVALLAAMFFLLRRITRPLAALTDQTERFARTQEIGEPLVPAGPDDVRRLITAHNRMETRIVALLDEKDVMLGAIGHDLKTPLAALRVRIESVEDPDERARMAASIEDITRSLDDILSLARVGRNREPAEPTDLGKLAISVVEEFEDMGEAVTLSDPARIVLPVHVTWLRRGLRNLISNAVRYGGSAHVSLSEKGEEIVLCVDDDGPGIPADHIADMTEPFIRGEASRNRETGGAGLGLTLARAIAEQHGGLLVLANRPEGGLRAEIRLPAK